MRFAQLSIIPLLATPVFGIGCFSKGIKFLEVLPDYTQTSLYYDIEHMCEDVTGEIYREDEAKFTCRTFGNNSIIMTTKYTGIPSDSPEQLTYDQCKYAARRTYAHCEHGGIFRPHAWSWVNVQVDPQEGRCVF